MQLFDLPHFLILLIIAGISFWVFVSPNKKWLAPILASLLVVSELSTALYASFLGVWSWKWALPFHLCDLAVIAVVITLIQPIHWMWELSFFWVLGGSIIALLTPDIARPFPDPLYLLFFFSHGGAVVSVFYLIHQIDYQFTLQSVKRVWIITHVIAGAIALFNQAFGTNYFFLCSRPSQFSLLDYFGPWPYYLFALEIFFTLSLFLLFVVYKKLSK